MRILILDDDDDRQKIFRQKLIGHEVVQTSTVKSTIQHLIESTWQYLFLDHDLGGQTYVKSGKDTGYEVAQWLEAHPGRQPKNIIIHSFNSVGAQNMASLLPTATICPGAWNNIIIEV